METFIDLDGDGKPDVGGKKGTSGADKLEGSDMDEKLEGAKGDDVLSGGKGDDFLMGGEGADTLIGGNGAGAIDTAAFTGSASIYDIATASKWVSVKDSDGTYETAANGDIKILTAANQASSGYTAVQGYSVTTKDVDGDGTVSDSEKSGSTTVVDLVFEVENFEFADAMYKSTVEVNVDDYDFDFVIDFAEVLGALGDDTIKASNTAGLDSLLPGWLSGASLNLGHVFAGNNFIDGGAGIDDIEAGAGDDFIDPGSVSKDKGEKVDGGAGNDTCLLYTSPSPRDGLLSRMPSSA